MMTPAQALAVMQAIRPLIGSRPVIGVDGLIGDLGQLVVELPAGMVMSVALELPHPLPFTAEELTALAATFESRIREVMSPFEVEAGRGFGGSRGTLQPGEAGFSAADGWV